LEAFSIRIATTAILAFEYSKFINLEKRSTFLIIQAENELKNSSAGLAKTFDDSGPTCVYSFI